MTSQEPLKFEDFIPLPPWLQPPSTMEQVSKTQFHMPSPRSTWLGAACRGALGSTRRPAEHLARRWADPLRAPLPGCPSTVFSPKWLRVPLLYSQIH